jgi:cell volume regulation protein A
MIDVFADKLFILVTSTLIICYISGLFYQKTKVPDIIWVLGFGILLGPVLGYFDKELFLEISPIMSTLALSVILFDAGINVDITTLMRTMAKSTILAICTFVTVVVSVGLLLNYLMPGSFTLLQGLLLGSMIGGTSTIAVFGILDGLERLIPDIESTRVILMMESVISDPICIIASITLIRMIMLPEISIVNSLMDIFTTFLLSSGLGLAVGQMWAEVLDRLRGRPFTYILTISILLSAYVIAERVIGEGSGPMTALCFGLMITNYGYITKRIGIKRNIKIDKRRLREFHEEITFFVKAFFFVYIGLIVTISMSYIEIGLYIVVVILVIRFIVATGVARILGFTRQEKVITGLIFAQGLPAFVMSQLPFIFDPNRQYFLNPEIYPNLAVPIVLGTVLFGAIAGPFLAKKQLA